MGVYVVTGGSGGIGGKTVEILREQGHEVINVDLKDSDISANLATKEGRDEVIQKIHELHPEGIDGLCCNAGVSGACGNVKLMVSLNYFGATNLAHGLFDLLKKKGGNCVVTSSNTISQGAARMDLVDMLNYSQTKPINEERILNILDDLTAPTSPWATAFTSQRSTPWPAGPGGCPLPGPPTACASTPWPPATSPRP